MAFARRCTITPLLGKVPSALSNFPVLIKVTHNDLKLIANGGYITDPDEIRPFSDGPLASMCPFERVYYDGTGGTVIMWAHVPTVDVGVPYYLGYADPALTAYAGSSTAWPSAFKYVGHGGDGSTPSGADSSQSGNNGTLQNSPGATAGLINGALTLNGSSQYMSLPNMGISGDGDRSISFWLYPTTLGGGSRYCFSFGVDALSQIFAIRMTTGASNGQIYSYRNGNDAFTAANVLIVNTWNHVLVTYDGSGNNTDIYVNGVESAIGGAGSNFGNDLNTTDTAWEFFRAFSTYFQGNAEELRIANVFRSSAFAVAEYNSILDPSTFASYVFGAAASSGRRNRSIIIG